MAYGKKQKFRFQASSGLMTWSKSGKRKSNFYFEIFQSISKSKSGTTKYKESKSHSGKKSKKYSCSGLKDHCLSFCNKLNCWSESGTNFYRKYKTWLSSKNTKLGKKIGWL